MDTRTTAEGSGSQSGRDTSGATAEHGGPRPAQPHPYLLRALMDTQGDLGGIFSNTLDAKYERILLEFANRGVKRRGGLTGATRARIRRGRR